MEDNFLLVKVDVDAKAKLAKKWKNNQTPSLFFIGYDGKEFSRLSGYVDPASLIYLLKETSRAYNLFAKGAEKIAKDPEDPQGNYGVGVGLRVKKKFWKAKSYLEKALAKAEKNPKLKDLVIRCHYELSKAYFYIPKQTDNLILHSKAVVDLDPKGRLGYTDESYVTLSVGYYKKRQHKKAFDVAQKVIREFPKSKYLGQAYHFQGLYALWMKKKTQCIQIWRKGIKLFPKDPWSKRSKAFLVRLGVDKKVE